MRASVTIFAGLRRQAASNGGFSLLEVIIATAVSSMIILMVYAMHRSIMTSIYELTGVAEYYENINLAINRIDRDISYCHQNKNNKNICFVGENNYGNTANGKVNFITTIPSDYEMTMSPKMPWPRSDIREVGYFLRQDKQIAGLNTLMRREENHFDDKPEEGGEASILLENVVDVKFEYWMHNDWGDKWDSRTAGRFPTAVRTSLRVRNYRGNEEEFIFISIIESTGS